jgi:hypothetical protein
LHLTGGLFALVRSGNVPFASQHKLGITVTARIASLVHCMGLILESEVLSCAHKYFLKQFKIMFFFINNWLFFKFLNILFLCFLYDITIKLI